MERDVAWVECEMILTAGTFRFAPTSIAATFSDQQLPFDSR